MGRNQRRHAKPRQLHRDLIEGLPPDRRHDVQIDALRQFAQLIAPVSRHDFDAAKAGFKLCKLAFALPVKPRHDEQVNRLAVEGIVDLRQGVDQKRQALGGDIIADKGERHPVAPQGIPLRARGPQRLALLGADLDIDRQGQGLDRRALGQEPQGSIAAQVRDRENRIHMIAQRRAIGLAPRLIGRPAQHRRVQRQDIERLGLRAWPP